MRLIDADKLKQHYAWWRNDDKEAFDIIVDTQPTVDPMTHSHWTAEGLNVWCSSCERGFVADSQTNVLLVQTMAFCPNCGARMDGVENG